MGISANLNKAILISNGDEFNRLKEKEGNILYSVNDIINQKLKEILEPFIYKVNEVPFIIAKEIMYLGSGQNFSNNVLENYEQNEGVLTLEELNKYYTGNIIVQSISEKFYNICNEEGWFADLNY
jgi:hypothetical protein